MILLILGLLGFNIALISEVISQPCLLVTLVLWPMCCQTGMPCRRHRKWHPSQYTCTDTGPTCCCVILWYGMSRWNTQLPILMSRVGPDQENSNHSPTFHTHSSTSWCCHGGSQSVESVPYPLSLELGTCSVQIHYAIRLPTAASFHLYNQLFISSCSTDDQ